MSRGIDLTPRAARATVLISLLASASCAPARRDASLTPSTQAEPAPASPATGVGPTSADSPGHAAPPAVEDVDDATCGELYLREVGLAAAGEGVRHPRRARLIEALAMRCGDGGVGDSLGPACVELRREREARQRDGYGPAHPVIRVLDAQIAVCPDAAITTQGAMTKTPSDSDCEALRRRRDELVAAGKGENHPARVAVRIRLAACADAGAR